MLFQVLNSFPFFVHTLLILWEFSIIHPSLTYFLILPCPPSTLVVIPPPSKRKKKEIFQSSVLPTSPSHTHYFGSWCMSLSIYFCTNSSTCNCSLHVVVGLVQASGTPSIVDPRPNSPQITFLLLLQFIEILLPWLCRTSSFMLSSSSWLG